MPGKFFKRHRVRASVYHIGASLFLLAATKYYILDGNEPMWYDMICGIYFVADYVAEMFDPNPDNPGPGVIRYFHRMYDGDCDDEQ